MSERPTQNKYNCAGCISLAIIDGSHHCAAPSCQRTEIDVEKANAAQVRNINGVLNALYKQSVVEANASHAQDVEEAEHALFMIYYDDRDMKPEILIGESGARERFAQVSVSWNAHLFGKLESNSRDSQFASANIKIHAKDAAIYETSSQILRETVLELNQDLRNRDAEIASLKAQLAEAQKVPEGFDEESLRDVAESLESNYESRINVGNVTGEGDEFVETDTAYAVRLIRAMLSVAPTYKKENL